MISIATLQDNLSKWINANTDTANEVYWAWQNMPENAPVDGSTNIVPVLGNFVRRQKDITTNTDTGIANRTGVREFTLTIKTLYGYAYETLINLIDSLENDTVRAALALDDIVFLRYTDVVNLSEVINSENIEEATCDVLFRIAIPYGDTATDEVGYYDTVEVALEITEGETVVSEDITIEQ